MNLAACDVERSESKLFQAVTNILSYRRRSFHDDGPSQFPLCGDTSMFDDVNTEMESTEQEEFSEELVSLLEKQSRVRLNDKTVVNNLKNAIKYAEQTKHIGTDNIQPMQAIFEQMRLRLRHDDEENFLGCRNDETLLNASKTSHGYFVSPLANMKSEK
ncbi:Glutamyl-tRNA(Gln) amidotransferase subunit C, mitochondrial [Trichinella pseudospiralis]|uniref:Glutamyl-tRNA(Gln) amidotransferase subunit C, mitochondrial n=1 Tax=Trichinella pseudospiralis TaxID=6337 RepID=A0A0V1FS45_TRIPS|nr:Glutamyl-tRNA(Gln) amidotransferase subunit C, mitochondrial [Trichinella pseudospiralis]